MATGARWNECLRLGGEMGRTKSDSVSLRFNGSNRCSNHEVERKGRREKTYLSLLRLAIRTSANLSRAQMLWITLVIYVSEIAPNTRNTTA